MFEQVDTFEIPRERTKSTDDIGEFTSSEQMLEENAERWIVNDIPEHRSLKMMRSARRTIGGPVQPTEEFTTNRPTKKIERGRIHGPLPAERQHKGTGRQPKGAINGRRNDKATPPGKRRRSTGERTKNQTMIQLTNWIIE